MNEREVVRVRDVMKHQFDIISGSVTIREALQTMEHVDAKCLIVAKRNEDDEIGILLISDIAQQVVGEGRSPDRVNAYEIMQKPVIGVHPDMDIRYCARLFGRFAVARTPVIENDEVVGIVSYSDLVIKGLTGIGVGRD